MGFSWPADLPEELPPAWHGVVFNHGDRIPLTLWAAACCSNPTPVMQTDRDGKAFCMCANCGART